MGMNGFGQRILVMSRIILLYSGMSCLVAICLGRTGANDLKKPLTEYTTFSWSKIFLMEDNCCKFMQPIV